ncbi:MAG: hypothetical protein H6745_13390 [Deltaproteobacteria bacterium]|nr:hypothetical protein [Deltaproteobacteria bacterium]
MTGSGGNDKGRWPEPDIDDTAATTQMDPEDIAELHRRLAAGPSAASEAETVMLDEERVADEVKRRAASRAPAPAPRPAAAPSGRGGGAFVVAGIGALLILVGAVAELPPIARELGREEWFHYVAAALLILGFGMLAPGMTLAVRRTNGLAGAAAVFCYLVVIGAILNLSLAGEVEPDLQMILAISLAGATALAWIFIGLWGLTSTGTVGGLAGGLGILALLGGLATATAIVVPLVVRFNSHSDLEVFGYVLLGGQAAIGVAALFTSIAFFGPVRNAPAR